MESLRNKTPLKNQMRYHSKKDGYSSMLSIILTILKILGIILLVLIITVFILLFIILFVPIRYEIKSTKKDKIQARARMHWFFHILRAEVTYQETLKYSVKALWFTFIDSSVEDDSGTKSDQETKDKKKFIHSKNTEYNKDNKDKKDKKDNNESDLLEPVSSGDKKIRKYKNNEESDENTNKKAKNSAVVHLIHKIKHKVHILIRKIRYTFNGICDKIKKVTQDIAYWKQLTEDPKCKAALKEAWKQMIRVLKSIRPRKFQADIILGTQDPSTLGQIMAWYGIFYPIYSYHIQIYPEFERVIFEYDAYLKGKITIFTILLAGIRLYFNKDIKYVIALFNREDK